MKAVVDKAAGRIKYWEIWNEPYNCPLLDSRTPVKVASTGLSYNTQYLVLLAGDAYRIVKNHNGGANKLVVLSPAFYPGRLDFMDRYLALGGRQYADVISVHAYDHFLGKRLNNVPTDGVPNSPETLFFHNHDIVNVKNVLSRHSYSFFHDPNRLLSKLPVWNTEAGYLEVRTLADGRRDFQSAAPYVARHLLLGWIAGLDRSYYYSWDLGGAAAALADQDPATKAFVQTAAGKAYEVIGQWIAGAQILGLSRPDTPNSTWVVSLRRAGRSTTDTIVWNPWGTAVSHSAPAGAAYRYTLSGSREPLASTTVTVDGSPILLSSQ